MLHDNKEMNLVFHTYSLDSTRNYTVAKCVAGESDTLFCIHFWLMVVTYIFLTSATLVIDAAQIFYTYESPC